MTGQPEKSGGTERAANKRGAARLAAVQALYQMDVGNISLEETLAQYSGLGQEREVEGDTYLPGDADFFQQVVRGVIRSQLEIDPVLDRYLSAEWPVGRIDAILRAVLRAAAFELLKKTDIPAGVVISEYVDVAKAFFDDEGAGMVNGVLDSIAAQRKEDAGD